MPRRGWRKKKLPIGDPADPDSFWSWKIRFLEDLGVRNYSEHTVVNRDNNLCQFFSWCLERGLTRPREITRPILQRYQRHLFHHRKAEDGKPLTFRTQHIRLSAVRVYFQWLTRKNALLYNPASDLEMPKLEKRLPRHILTPQEAEAILSLPDLATPVGVRNRAILETFYSTGIRRIEMTRLGVFDLDGPRGTLTVRQGKGKKDRVVPIGERAMAWVEKYLQEVRPLFVVEPDPGTLYLTDDGHPMDRPQLSLMVREYVNAADLGKRGSCHLWRHTCATLMLENGADIRFIQEMLGHAELRTTQIYTQVSIKKLKEIHTATHPGARLRDASTEEPEEGEEEQAEDPGKLETTKGRPHGRC